MAKRRNYDNIKVEIILQYISQEEMTDLIILALWGSAENADVISCPGKRNGCRKNKSNEKSPTEYQSAGLKRMRDTHPTHTCIISRFLTHYNQFRRHEPWL